VAATIVDISGLGPAKGAPDVRDRVDAQRFFWLDLVGDDPARAAYLGALDLENVDVGWALRFGQAGRMHIARERLRAVTWIGQPNGGLAEIHIVGCPRGLVTIWNGDSATLDDIRQQFAERIAGFERNFYQAAGILLQLLLGTLDHVIRGMDLVFDELRTRLDKDPHSLDFTLLARRQQRMQSIVGSFDRYSSSVRSAIVGVETISGVDASAAAELNDYAEQVEDVEEQLYERRRWMSDMTHDYSAALAQRQSEQINRLTLVSLIFLPMSALTGFFGMNFDWLNRKLATAQSFFLLGLLLPIVCVAATMAWLAYRGLIRFTIWPLKPPQRAVDPAAREFWDPERRDLHDLDPSQLSASAKYQG
jgi:Mg2+ and Co2+ transporter CorA